VANLKPLCTRDHVEGMLTSHIVAHIEAATLPSVTRQILKGIIDGVRECATRPSVR